MKVKNYRDVEAVSEAPGAAMRWVIDEKDGAPNFALRIVELEPGASTPFHNHDWEHEVFILEGEGVVKSEQGDMPFNSGTVVFVPPNERHQFRNTGEKPVKFLCLIPYKG